MNGADPLAQLRPLHLPEPVGWWPPAPGWWLLALLVAGIAFVAVRLLLRWLRGRRYRGAALRELERLHADCIASGDTHAFAAAANALLRRAALARYPRHDVAALHGTAWIAFLDARAGRPLFTGNTGNALTRAAYDPHASCDAEALHRAAREWLRRHR